MKTEKKVLATFTRPQVDAFLRGKPGLSRTSGYMLWWPCSLIPAFAVSYLRAGGNLYYLARILGRVKTTEQYSESLGVEDLQAVHDRLSLLTR